MDTLTATLDALAAYRDSVTEAQWLALEGTPLGALLDALTDLEESATADS